MSFLEADGLRAGEPIARCFCLVFSNFVFYELHFVLQGVFFLQANKVLVLIFFQHHLKYWLASC